jgi:drug/metabolite transporter (DMT)-like permease
MMNAMVWAPALLATAGYAGYHVLQKSVPADTPPLLATAVAYAVGLAACLLAITLSGGWGNASWRHIANGPTIGVGIAIIGIELGYLLAYRGGGALGTTALWVSSLANILLVLVSLTWGQERLDLSRIAGLAFSMIGLVLMSCS